MSDIRSEELERALVEFASDTQKREAFPHNLNVMVRRSTMFDVLAKRAGSSHVGMHAGIEIGLRLAKILEERKVRTSG